MAGCCCVVGRGGGVASFALVKATHINNSRREMRFIQKQGALSPPDFLGWSLLVLVRFLGYHTYGVVGLGQGYHAGLDCE